MFYNGQKIELKKPFFFVAGEPLEEKGYVDCTNVLVITFDWSV